MTRKYVPRAGLDHRALKVQTAHVSPSLDRPVAIRLEGLCPWCDDPTTSEPHPLLTYGTPATAGVATVIANAASAVDVLAEHGIAPRHYSEDVPAVCRCQRSHAGRGPTDPPGCGAHWTINVSWSVDDTAVLLGPPKRPTSLSDFSDEESIRNALGDQLTQVRKAADAWQKGIAGLLTILTGVLFLKGQSAVSKIDQDWQYAIAAILVYAAVLAIASTFFFMEAATGFPTETEVDDIREEGLYPWQFEQARDATNQLSVGIGLFLGTLVLVGGATLATWFAPGPEAAPGTPLVSFTPTGATKPVCGTLKKAANGQYVIVQDTAATNPTLMASDLSMVAVVDSCP